MVDHIIGGIIGKPGFVSCSCGLILPCPSDALADHYWGALSENIRAELRKAVGKGIIEETKR